MNFENSKNNNNPNNDDDFASSMAKLAELASKDLGPDKPKEDKNVKIDDELLKEFMKPKRKAKPKGFKEKWAGKTIKLNINPYVASGILIVILSVGIIAAPKIAKHYELKRLAEEQEKQRLASIANQTDNKLKTYNVFEAAKDVGGNSELKTKNLTELTKTIEEGNKLAEEKAAREATQLAMNNLAVNSEDIRINLYSDSEDSKSLDEITDADQVSALDPSNVNLYWDFADLPQDINLNFDLRQSCQNSDKTSVEEQELLTEILKRYFVFSGNNC